MNDLKKGARKWSEEHKRVELDKSYANIKCSYTSGHFLWLQLVCFQQVVATKGKDHLYCTSGPFAPQVQSASAGNSSVWIKLDRCFSFDSHFRIRWWMGLAPSPTRYESIWARRPFILVCHSECSASKQTGQFIYWNRHYTWTSSINYSAPWNHGGGPSFWPFAVRGPDQV